MKKYVMKCDYTNRFGGKVKKGQSIYRKEYGMVDVTGMRIFQYDSIAYRNYVKELEVDTEEINIELIINKEETIAIVKDENGKFKKGISKPYYQDKYDKNTGIIIAIQKALGIYEDVEDIKKVEDKVNNGIFIDIDWEDFQKGGIFITFKDQNEVDMFLRYILENHVANVDEDDFKGYTIEEKIKFWKKLNLLKGENFIRYSECGGRYLVADNSPTGSQKRILIFSNILKVDKSTTLLDDATDEELVSELLKRMKTDMKLNTDKRM